MNYAGSALRLLFVSHSLPPTDRPMSNVGGMQRVATELYDSLQDADGVRLSSQLLRSSFFWSHVKVVPFMASTYRKIRQMAERREIDAVLFSSMVTASMSVKLKDTLRRNGVISASIVHGLDVTMDLPVYQRLVPRVFDSLDLVLPVSRATQEACIERGLDPARSVVVPNGIDTDRFPSPPGSRRGRRTLLEGLDVAASADVQAAPFILASVGRQVKRKGFAWFIHNVMPLLPENVHYWLAGDGPENENIRTAIEARNLQDRVKVLGRLSENDLSRLYRGADLFVMPNVPVAGDMEGFGVVMLEAGLAGLPVIASRLEGIRDVISEGENGHFIESGNAWDFSEAIARYVYDDDALLDASRRSVRYIRDNFGWKAVANRYVQVIEGRMIPATADESAMAS